MSRPPTPGLGASKADWRRWAGPQWDEVDLAAASGAVVNALRSWQPLHEAETILLYLPMQGELDLTGLADSITSATLAVTRTPSVGPLTVHRFEEPFERHPFGFLQPLSAAEQLDPESVDLALVPGRCFDRRGGRLGRGAGYYDELLADGAGTGLRVGVVPAALVVPRLPTVAHDMAMTHLVTEDGVSPVSC